MLDEAKLLVRVENLERELEELKANSARSPFVVPIASLLSESLELYRPISAVVQQEDEAYVASFFDANINASGESQLEAVEELKEAIVARFRLFASKEAILGDEPRRQLAVLRQFIRNV